MEDYTGFNKAAEGYEWAIRISCHMYVTLYYYGKFVRCYDNSIEYADAIIAKIEKRTRKKITELPLVECDYEDGSGFRFCGKGFMNFLGERQ